MPGNVVPEVRVELTQGPLPGFELVAAPTTRPHQPFYVPQSCLQCSNAFHQTSGDIQPLDGILDDELTAVYCASTGHQFQRL